MKNIFRPTISRLLVAVFLVVILVPFLELQRAINYCVTTPCSQPKITLLRYLSEYVGEKVAEISVVFLIIGTFIAYILSCIVVWVFTKSFKHSHVDGSIPT